MEARADPILHRQPHAHGLRDDEDVAEDDRGVDAEQIHRLQGDLDGQLRRTHHGEEVGALPHRAILGEVAAGLAHHPDRGPLHGLALAGAEEEIVHVSFRSSRARAREPRPRAPLWSGVWPRRRAAIRRSGPPPRSSGPRRAAPAGRQAGRPARAGRPRSGWRPRRSAPAGPRAGPPIAGQHRPVAHDLLDRDAASRSRARSSSRRMSPQGKSTGPLGGRRVQRRRERGGERRRGTPLRRRAHPAGAPRRGCRPTLRRAGAAARPRSRQPCRRGPQPAPRRPAPTGRGERHRGIAAKVAHRRVHRPPVERRGERHQRHFDPDRDRTQRLGQAWKGPGGRSDEKVAVHQGSGTTGAAAARTSMRIDAAPSSSSRSARAIRARRPAPRPPRDRSRSPRRPAPRPATRPARAAGAGPGVQRGVRRDRYLAPALERRERTAPPPPRPP